MDEVKLGVFHEARLLKSEGLSQNAITNVWMKASGFYQIHWGIQQFPQVGSQCRQIEKRAALFQVDQKINIAIGVLFEPTEPNTRTLLAPWCLASLIVASLSVRRRISRSINFLLLLWPNLGRGLN